MHHFCCERLRVDNKLKQAGFIHCHIMPVQSSIASKLPSIGYDDYQVCSMKGVSMYKSSGFCLITSSRVGGIWLTDRDCDFQFGQNLSKQSCLSWNRLKPHIKSNWPPREYSCFWNLGDCLTWNKAVEPQNCHGRLGGSNELSLIRPRSVIPSRLSAMSFGKWFQRWLRCEG